MVALPSIISTGSSVRALPDHHNHGHNHLQQQLTAALKNRLGREVSLVTRIDESLIGGAVIRAGDMVFDGSVSGQLNKLATTLMH